MPELRKDPITSRWVIISTERGKRPHDFVVEPEVAKGGFCPFCPGNEHTTPPEIMAYREGGGSLIRQVGNLELYPINFRLWLTREL